MSMSHHTNGLEPSVDVGNAEGAGQQLGVHAKCHQVAARGVTRILSLVGHGETMVGLQVYV